jgi:hypothetical protein
MDSRFGFSTHFDQGWNPATVIPQILTTPAQYIRDDMNWQVIEGVTQGVYNASAIKPFWNIAITAGLKCVAIIGANNGNPLYANPFDPTGMANFCVWLVGQLPTLILEILNEPNNVYAGQEGVTWPSQYVTLINTVTTAVNAVSPSTIIIGYGGQGSQVLTMLANGTPTANGVVYHPYDPGNNISAQAYEPPYTDYGVWVSAVRAVTSLPIWETERNFSPGGAAQEYYGGVWNSQRLLQSYGLGIEHTFLYDFEDGSLQSAMNSSLRPLQTYFVINRVLGPLQGLMSTGAGVNLIPGASNFDMADFISFVFSSVTSTVAALWLANHSPGFPPMAGQGTVSFPCSNSVGADSYVMDTVRGLSFPLGSFSTTFTGGVFTIFAFAISDHPMMIVLK